VDQRPDPDPDPDPAQRDDAEDPTSAGPVPNGVPLPPSQPHGEGAGGVWVGGPEGDGAPAWDWDDGWDGLPACPPEDDFDPDAEMARWVADTEAGRERVPEPWELEGPAVSVSLGDAADVDPAVLASRPPVTWGF
jgi:hypothetical protein